VRASAESSHNPPAAHPSVGDGASLVLHDLSAGYGDLQVLRGISCSLRPGELVVLAGPNGAGKTTLLSTIIGTVKGWGGSVRVGEREVLGMPIHLRTRLGLGLVPEGRGLFPKLTVWENLRVAVKAARLNRDEADAGIKTAMDAFPIIRERRSQEVRLLSGGEQQMLAIGRALITQPRVLLLDEPSVGLAPIIWRRVLDTCRALADGNRVVLLAEQRVLEALDPADRCIVLSQGRVVRDGTADRDALDLPELTSSYFDKRGDA
jgi:branched-chain amino acid transport system ATP-binding protein